VYNALALPSEVCTRKQKDKKRLTRLEINFSEERGDTLFDHRRKEAILEEMKVEAVD
jgi:hypothetical protein